MPIEYITTRSLTNSKGEEKGKMRIAKLVGEPDAIIEFTCPECGSVEKKRENWAEPFVIGEGKNQKFFVKCEKCRYSVKIEKLKKEMKKKK